MKYDTSEINRLMPVIALVRMAGGSMNKAGSSYRGACPLHSGDNPTGFQIDIASGKWRCWTKDCGAGDSIDFVMVWRHTDFNTACEWILSNTGNTLVESTRKEVDSVIKELEDKIAKAQILLTELKRERRWQFYHEQLTDEARFLWQQNGVPLVWQELWGLGYDPHHYVWVGYEYFTPTLTIPVFAPGKDLRNIRHRLLKPVNPHDKYRPEKAGLPAYPFLSDNSERTNYKRVLIVEGEKKAMVTYLTLEDPDSQVLGIPGKKTPPQAYADLIPDNANVYCIFDPGGEADAINTAQFFGFERSKIMNLSGKIDDLILETNADQALLEKLLTNATRIKGD